MKALVTGGGGFLGQYIVEQLLVRGDSVRSFSRKKYQALDELGVEQVQGDLQNAEQVMAACTGVDVVFHVAAIAGIWGEWKTYYGINTLGTRNVIAGCQKQGVPRLVYSSSPSVVFDGRDQCGIDESAPYPQKWLCGYPHSKALAEKAVLAADSESLMTCALRPHLIWGPRDQHLIPRLISRARSGRLRMIGSGKNLVDNIFVENAAQAHLQAAEALASDSPVRGRAYFISQGQPVNCWDWINEILVAAGENPVQRKISFRTAWVVGSCLEGIYRILGRKSEPPMTRFLAAQLATSHYYSIKRAQADFGYHPTVDHQTGMQQLAASIRGPKPTPTTH